MYIFRQAKIAIFDFDKYCQLLKTKLSKVILYALVFIMFFNILYSAYPFFIAYTQTKGFNNFVEKYIPNFNIENDKLVFNKYYKKDTPLGMTIIFDPEENNNITKEDKENINGSFILKATPTQIIFSDSGIIPEQLLSDGINLKIKVSDISKIFNIKNKQDLINLKSYILFANLLIFIFIFLFTSSLDIMLLILFSILTGLVSSFYKIKLNSIEIFKVTVYSSTIAYILKNILMLFSMPMPSIIYLGVVIAYLHFIFKNMPSEYKIVETNTN